MRRTYISPEFKNDKVFGTLNMLEESNFFGAKMLEVEDSLLINNDKFVWYEMSTGEQFDLDTETTIEPQIMSLSDKKESLHTISLDETQSQYGRDNSTQWIIDIKLSEILAECLYAKIKTTRTFEGIRSNMTIYNNVNQAVKNYVWMNVVNRYKISRIDLYIKYVELKSQNVLRFRCGWDENLAIPTYLNRKIQTTFDYNQDNVRITFKQEKPSTQYKIDYYFNLFFEKI